MTTAAGLALVALGAHYFVRLAAFSRGFARTVRQAEQTTATPADPPFVTVIVAARNEEAVIGRCVDAILASDYPTDRFEVIVSDDDSSDATAEVVRQRRGVPAGGHDADGPDALRVVHVPGGHAGVHAVDHSKFRTCQQLGFCAAFNLGLCS